MRTSCRIAATCLVAIVPAVVNTALAQAEPTPLGTLALDDLQRAYLGCDGAAARGRLDTASIARCSVIYEHLKRQAFQGDFERLLAWSRAQQARRSDE